MAAIYVRISQDRGGGGLGVARQEEDCRGLCEKLGWTVAGVYKDNDTSAYSGKPRKRWEQLLKDVESGRVDAIACWHVDRLTRTPRELENVIDMADSHGLKLATFTGEIDLATPTGRMVARILGATVRQESEHKAERQRRANLQKAEAGKDSGGGTRSFGYNQRRRVPEKKDQADDKTIEYVVEPDPTAEPNSVFEPEAKEIRWAAQQILNGASISSIRRAWADRGVETVKPHPTPDGKPFWSRTAVRNLLKSPRIAGLRQHQGKNYPAVWPAIIDKATWEAVCIVLNAPSRQQRRPNRTYPLLGILSCGACGSKLSGCPRGKDRYYSCRRDAGGCGAVWIKAWVEDFVLGILLVLAESPATLALLQRDENVDAEQLRTLIAVKGDYEVKLAGLEDKFADDLLSPEAYTRNRMRLQGLIDPLAQRIAHLRGNTGLGSLGPGVQERWPDMTPDERRQVLHALVHEIEIAPKVRRGGNKFEPKRLTFVWRSGALAQAVGLGDDGELDMERLEHVWQTGALKDLVAMDPALTVERAMTQTGRSPLLEQNAVGVLVRGTELAGVLVLPDGIDAPESNVFVDSRLSTWQKPRVKRI